MDSLKIPAASETAPEGSGSQGKGKQRFSSTGKFLQNIFCRLIPPYSPNPRASSPSTLSSQPPSSIHQHIRASEEPNMAAASARLGASRTRESAEFTVPQSRIATHNSDGDKENRPPAPTVANTSASLGRLSIDNADRPLSSLCIAHESSNASSDKPVHQIFMDQALDMARLALRTNETPVGCVLVHNGIVVARGMNATNVTRNGTRHAEFMALSALLSFRPANSPDAAAAQLEQQSNERAKAVIQDDESDLFPMDDDYVKKGHIYPYGQKLLRAPRVDRSIVRDCILYVTVEPCVMCAGFLRQLGIKKVYFGAVNDKFGGTGGVFSIHKNSTSVHHHSNTSPIPKPLHVSANVSNLPCPVSPSSGKDLSNSICQQTTTQGGDGGNVEPGFEAEGGWGRDEAVSLLRRFYVQENGRAPVPRKKEGRAARLAAMEQAGSEGGTPVVPMLSDVDASNDVGPASERSEVAKA